MNTTAPSQTTSSGDQAASFNYSTTQYGLQISHAVVPARLQLRRRRELLLPKIRQAEERLARPARLDCPWDAGSRAAWQRDLIRDRALVESIDAQLATRPSPLAA